MRSNDVLVTGAGIRASLGPGLDECWDRVVAGDSGIERDVSIDDSGIARWLARASAVAGEDRLLALTSAAVDDCLKSGEIEAEGTRGLGFVFSHGTPDCRAVVREANRLERTGRARPDTVYRMMNSYVAASVAKEKRFTGPVVSNAAACAGSAQAVHLGVCMIRSGMLDRCICGGGEIVDWFTYSAFRSMRVVLAGEQVSGKPIVEPFGINRSGIVLGEAAGFLLLERADLAVERGARPLFEISSSYVANVPDAVYGEIADIAAWRTAILSVDPDRECQYVVAHGTSTRRGDSVEGQAILKTLGDTPVASYKHYLGHTLSASSVIDLALLSRSFSHDLLIGSGSHCEVEPDLRGGRFLADHLPQAVDKVLKLSAGFGGSVSALKLSRTQT